jgi:hypothetical protein
MYDKETAVPNDAQEHPEITQHSRHTFTDKEKYELATAEGHDADIPSNIGALSGEKCHDIERGGSTTSHTTADDKPDEDDPNVVWWDGDDDQENPMNWSEKKKWTGVALLGIITLITYVPSLDQQIIY